MRVNWHADRFSVSLWLCWTKQSEDFFIIIIELVTGLITLYCRVMITWKSACAHSKSPPPSVHVINPVDGWTPRLHLSFPVYSGVARLELMMWLDCRDVVLVHLLFLQFQLVGLSAAMWSLAEVSMELQFNRWKLEPTNIIYLAATQGFKKITASTKRREKKERNTELTKQTQKTCRFWPLAKFNRRKMFD